MKRSMTVKNVGGTTIRNVTLSGFNGRTVHINEVKPGQDRDDITSRQALAVPDRDPLGRFAYQFHLQLHHQPGHREHRQQCRSLA